MKTSLVIATKNRKDDLRRAIASAMRQAEPVEIVVIDDGSSDGTADMVRSEFPTIRLEQAAVSLGYIAQRNHGASMCSGDIIFSIDDDAEFSTANVVGQTLQAFSHDRVAAVAIPYTEPHKSPCTFQIAPDETGIWLTDSFRGTAHALRRDVFLKLGGYRKQFVHQGEEMDLCIRLLEGGYVVRLGTGDPIIHHEAQRRDWTRMDFYGRRNDILFAWKNVPMPYLPTHLAGTTYNGFVSALRTRRPVAMLRGIAFGYWDSIFKTRAEPVSIKVYSVHRLLKKRGPRMLSEIEPSLPPLMAPIEARDPLAPRRESDRAGELEVKEVRTPESEGAASERKRTRTVPIAVIIPTATCRPGLNYLLEKIENCDPQPAEILIHLDATYSGESAIGAFVPGIRVLTSVTRQGPGGGRHKCLLACSAPYAASFDDDSYPVDRDYFGRLWQLFSENPRAAIFGATIWHRNEPPRERAAKLVPRPSFVGCGCGLRVNAYKDVRGYLPRPIAYGLEESDLSLQFFAAGWEIYEAGDLRVFHDSDLDHHKSARVTSGVIANVGLFAFLHYPLIGWGRGLAQVANKVFYCIRMNRLRGIVSGILRIPVDCYHYRQYRNPLGWPVVKRYLQYCRTNSA